MKDILTVVAIWAFIIFIIVGVVHYNVSIWNECRQTNSFSYCWHITSRQ